MGKTPINLKIDGQRLRHILKAHDLNFSERAESYGVTRQALNAWLSSGRIPARALIELALDLNLSAAEIDQVVVSSKDDPTPERKRKWQVIIEEL